MTVCWSEQQETAPNTPPCPPYTVHSHGETPLWSSAESFVLDRTEKEATEQGKEIESAQDRSHNRCTRPLRRLFINRPQLDFLLSSSAWFLGFWTSAGMDDRKTPQLRLVPLPVDCLVLPVRMFFMAFLCLL